MDLDTKKALEAWQRIKEFDSGGEFVSLYDTLETEIEIIDKALTDKQKEFSTPTEEEVCKALSEYFGEEVIFNGRFVIAFRIGSFGNVLDFAIQMAKDKRYDLITMIGQFYEGWNNGKLG